MKIIIDADACPRNVLQICYRLGKKYSRPIWTVANFNHCLGTDNHIVVGDGSQEADMKIMNICQPGDVVITQDGGLAAMVTAKGVFCLDPLGQRLKIADIDVFLELRAAEARYRQAGGRTRGPRKRTAEDDCKFAEALERVLRSKKG